MLGKRNEMDIRMLQRIGETNDNTNDVLIIDARSHMVAQANRFKGGGFEQEDYYQNCKIIFGDIDNIHGVRDAYKLCFPSWTDQWYSKDHDEILDKLNYSKWMQCVQSILKMAKHMTKVMIFEQKSILVHCSDGWDRTAQLGSLTQIMIDPYFRTLKGLEVIIEKEWVSFGYQFDKRNGNFENENHDADERSPVFIQFLDALYQIMDQFPCAFQYNTRILKFIAQQIYTCKFGTFL
jgi:hypothetical protein